MPVKFRFLVLFVFLLVSHTSLKAQIATYNQYPTLYTALNEENLSFALSMRRLYIEYSGPIIRLRRDSDNEEKDFYSVNSESHIDTYALDASFLVNIAEINTWATGSNLYVVRWYDQGDEGRDAIQNTTSLQPQFIADATMPYFFGNSSDRLTVETSIQELTNDGANGTVIIVASAVNQSQFTFGAAIGSDRWSGHLNWNNGNLYFDPGICCNSSRYFYNNSGVNVFKQYSFVRRTNYVLVRKQGAVGFSGLHTTGRTTINKNFGILWADGFVGNYSRDKITELIMYNTDLSTTKLIELESNQISFWGL